MKRHIYHKPSLIEDFYMLFGTAVHAEQTKAAAGKINFEKVGRSTVSKVH